jgi:hypothetical protein
MRVATLLRALPLHAAEGKGGSGDAAWRCHVWGWRRGGWQGWQADAAVTARAFHGEPVLHRAREETRPEGLPAAEDDDSGRARTSSLSRFFSKSASIAPPGYNRYASVPYSFLVQLSVGSVYAWSVFNAPLTRECGVVTSAADDWSLSLVLPIFSACALTLGATTALLGGSGDSLSSRQPA